MFNLDSVVWEQSNIQPAQSVSRHSNDHFITTNDPRPKENHIKCPELYNLEKDNQYKIYRYFFNYRYILFKG